MTGLRRAAASHAAIVIAVLVAGAGLAGAALVGFSAEDQNASSTYAGGWLGAPTGLGTPSAGGYGASLSWTPATHGLNNQAIYETDEGTTNSCAGATYSTVSIATVGATASSATTNEASGANGHYVCYQVRSILTGTQWSNSANFAIVQVGLRATSMVSNEGGGNPGKIENGDTIVISFNQNVNYGGGSPIAVCAFSSGTLLIGDSGCGSASDTPTIAKVTGLSIGVTKTYPSSAVSGSGSSTLTITIGGGGNGANGRTTVSGGGTVTWVGGSSVVASTTGSAPVCTLSNCGIAWTSGF